MGISVIICTYNGERRLPATIHALLDQQKINFDFEIIIVDNASTDNTYKLSAELLSKSSVNHTVVKQLIPGVAFAREKGIQTAKHDLVLFCDDDNWLDNHYLYNAYKIMSENPTITLLGGTGEAVFESTQPVWFDTFKGSFACGENVVKSELSLYKVDEIYSAGMVFRLEFMHRLREIGFQSLLKGRTGNEIISGEDTEYCMMAKIMNREVYTSSILTFKHYMTESRMNLEYLKKLHKGFGKSRVVINAYQYVIEHDAIPNLNIKLPFWKDQLLYKKRELRKFYPKIWFVNQTKLENLDFVLKLEALRGEIEQIEQLGDAYIQIYRKVLALKKQIENR